MVKVTAELGLFDSALSQKPQLVVVNKIDLPRVGARLADIKEDFDNVGIPVFFISAVGAVGVDELMAKAMEMLSQVVVGVGAGEKILKAVFHPQPRDIGADVNKEGNGFVVVASKLERIVARVDMASPEVRRQFQRQLVSSGVKKALEKAGVKPGDKVRCGNFIWEW